MKIDKKRIDSLEKSSWDELEKIAKVNKDLAMLIEDYNAIKSQKFSKQILNGYLAAINDLSYIKRLKK